MERSSQAGSKKLMKQADQKHWDVRDGCRDGLSKTVDPTELASVVLLLLFFETGYHFEPRLAWNSLCCPNCPQTSYEPPASARITDMSHCAQL